MARTSSADALIAWRRLNSSNADPEAGAAFVPLRTRAAAEQGKRCLMRHYLNFCGVCTLSNGGAAATGGRGRCGAVGGPEHRDARDKTAFPAGPRQSPRDRDAAPAGLTLPGSSGVVEGHVNRIKMLKRQKFGRSGFGLLRKRVLLAG